VNVKIKEVFCTGCSRQHSKEQVTVIAGLLSLRDHKFAVGHSALGWKGVNDPHGAQQPDAVHTTVLILWGADWYIMLFSLHFKHETHFLKVCCKMCPEVRNLLVISNFYRVSRSD
jgi:hypothetical protein